MNTANFLANFSPLPFYLMAVIAFIVAAGALFAWTVIGGLSGTIGSKNNIRRDAIAAAVLLFLLVGVPYILNGISAPLGSLLGIGCAALWLVPKIRGRSRQTGWF